MSYNTSSPPVNSTTQNNYYYYDYYYYYYYYYDDDDTWMTHVSVEKILKYCGKPQEEMVWLGLKVFILVTALPANCALFWLLFKSIRNLSPSQLLAFNISILDILFCLSLPFQIYDKLSPVSDLFHHLTESVLAFNIFGCPMFLSLMCLERYIAASFPMVYLRFGKRKPRIILSFVTWILTFLVSVLLFYHEEFVTFLSLAIVISIFFLIMILCLAGIVFVLCQSGPGDGASGSDSLKKRALVNIIIVIVPSAIAYIPLVAMVCYISVIVSKTRALSYTPERCSVVHYLLTFPDFGLYVGPLFYMSMIRQITCCKTTETEQTMSPTQGE